MSLSLAIPRALRERQQQASDPRASAWVSANAGSGKTHVLTQRVLRLLLKGTPPAQIVCLTFTKAAAANMATRVFRTLAHWTSLDDEALAAAIVDAGAEKPSLPELAFARRLFARTVETPGGLQIQTIHAFSERLLQRFPFEANVAAHFRVIDEREAKALMGEARDRAIAALRSSPDAHALARAASEAGAFRFDPLIAKAQGFADTFAAFPDAARYEGALRTRLGVAPDRTAASIEAEMLGGDVGRRRRAAFIGALDAGKTQDQRIAESLRAADDDGAPGDRIDALLDAFFTEEGQPRGGEQARLISKRLREKHPRLEADLRCEQDRLEALRELRRAAQTVERSAALFAVMKPVLEGFARAKADRGQLDFADQIARTLALVTRSSAAWVLERLDYGVDHLLVDEAQDTSADQWRILTALSAEFFAGEGAREGRRTVFAVGDEKQSIFSFQGAAPEKFAEMRRYFSARHRDAGRDFANVPLNFSFRSAPTILAAIDKTFGSERARPGLDPAGEPGPLHQAVRNEMKGVVELWPVVKASADADPADWRLPLDQLGGDAPAATLATRIAETIRGWLSPATRERIVDPRSGAARRIREGDVMILVRSRNGFFEAMIRRLKERGVKVAGADRLMLREHIAVMDLLAAGRAALSPEDDLTLATVLKSPLIGLSEDQLFALAAQRAGSLAAALAAHSGDREAEAGRRLAIWRARAKRLSPYDFYARLLGEDRGRSAMLARLGADAADPIDEFLALALAHERSEAPSLHHFLAEVGATEMPLKRDMEGESDGVRVLTVHASKGLESPIVFLPDTCGAPDGRHDPRLLRLDPARPGEPLLFAWGRRAAEDCKTLAAARAEARAAEAREHRRLLYVAMTRAGQRLIVAGYETARGQAKDRWHDLVSEGLEDSLVPAPAPWDRQETILRMGEGLSANGDDTEPVRAVAATLPTWILARAAQETTAKPLRPSQARIARPDGRERALEGEFAHALLNLMPKLPPAQWNEAARAYLARRAPRLGEAAADALAAQAIAVLEAPQLAPLFGPGSRGEVALAGVVKGADGEDIAVSGRLDRLVVGKACITLVDFKIGARPDAPLDAHVTQLALYRAILRPLYPSLPVRAALVYFDGPTLQPIADEALEAALLTNGAAAGPGGRPHRGPGTKFGATMRSHFVGKVPRRW